MERHAARIFRRMAQAARAKLLTAALGLLLSAGLVAGTLSPVLAAEMKAERYASLQGVKQVKVVFDFRIGEPKSALLHLDVIQQTCKDAALHKGKKPVFAVVFSGESVTLLSKNRAGVAAAAAQTLDEIAAKIAALAKAGVRLEVCRIALQVFAIDPAAVLPEIHEVGNGYVSLIGYGAKRYSLVPVY